MKKQRGDQGNGQSHGKEALRLWLKLLSCESLLEQHVRSRLRIEFGVTLPQFDVLAELDYMDKALSMSELSTQLMVSNGNITGVVDRLVREKFVERLSVAGDRRKQLIRLSRKGRREFTKMAREHELWVAEALGDVDIRELQKMTRLLASTGEKLKLKIGKHAT